MDMRFVSGRLLLAGFLLIGLWAAVHAAASLVLIKERSQIEFVGTKPTGLHRGGFKRFTADGAADWGDLSRSSFTISIDTTSLWSDNNALTNHLSNSDFFNVSRYPTIAFETTKIEIMSATEAVVTGNLTMLGQTVEVVLPCKIEVTDGSLQVGSEFKIDRTRWGMTYGKGRVDNEVEIAVKLIFGK
jgi:polyisoprenoid-binding protein YceI